MDNKKKNLISLLILLIGIIFPVGLLLGLIADKIAFPIMFICLGCQQLFIGLKDKPVKLFSILFGILFIMLTIFIIIPKYYFR